MTKKEQSPYGKRYSTEFKEKVRPTVVKLARLGCTDTEISSIIEMGEVSVKTHMRVELDEGRSNMRTSLRKAQLKAAIDERNPTMLIWLGKCYLGQKEPKKELEHSGALTVEKVVYVADEK